MQIALNSKTLDASAFFFLIYLIGPINLKGAFQRKIREILIKFERYLNIYALHFMLGPSEYMN